MMQALEKKGVIQALKKHWHYGIEPQTHGEHN